MKNTIEKSKSGKWLIFAEDGRFSFVANFNCRQEEKTKIDFSEVAKLARKHGFKISAKEIKSIFNMTNYGFFVGRGYFNGFFLDVPFGCLRMRFTTKEKNKKEGEEICKKYGVKFEDYGDFRIVG